MAKITYASLKVKANTDVETFVFNDKTIEVLKYLPAEDKYDLIINTLESSEADGIYSPVLLDMYFHLYLVYMYTNITFTDKQKEDEFKLYDTLQSSGLIDMVLEKISDTEYNLLKTYLEDSAKYLAKSKQGIEHFLTKLLDDMGGKIEGLQQMINDVDEGKYGEVIDFAKFLNGGRDI